MKFGKADYDAFSDGAQAPRVSVVVVNFNSGARLPKVLAALETQEFRDFELFIVDNASSDGSVDSIPAVSYPVHLVRLKENLGFAAANNIAIRASNSPWIALLNPDAYPEPGWLLALVRASVMYPDAAMFGSRILMYGDASILDGVGDAYHISGLHWRLLHGRPKDLAPVVGFEIFSPCAAAALYRRYDIVEAGLFDEDYFCYSEDVDLGFRVRLLGGRARYVPDADVLHESSGITGRYSDFSSYYGHRNYVWTFFKNMPGFLLFMALPFHFAGNLLGIFVLARRGQARIAFRAKVDAVAAWRSVIRKRREIQSRRVVNLWGLLKLLNFTRNASLISRVG